MDSGPDDSQEILSKGTRLNSHDVDVRTEVDIKTAGKQQENIDFDEQDQNSKLARESADYFLAQMSKHMAGKAHSSISDETQGLSKDSKCTSVTQVVSDVSQCTSVEARCRYLC